MYWLSHTVKYFLGHWGYWAIVVGLLGENAGLPLPGEAVLISSSFLASKHNLHLYYIIPIATAACILGDNIGYWLGHRFGKTFIRWLTHLSIEEQDVTVAKDLIRRHGGKTIFFARFVFGLRTVAGLLAGMLGMEWRRFFKFNALGAATWVTVMSFLGYLFGATMATFEDYFEYASWSIAAVLFTIGYLLWRRYRKSYIKRNYQHPGTAAA
jgi:membrane protein DedA with SNARE-associated domain